MHSRLARRLLGVSSHLAACSIADTRAGASSCTQSGGGADGGGGLADCAGCVGCVCDVESACTTCRRAFCCEEPFPRRCRTCASSLNSKAGSFVARDRR
eukprot:5043192-Pleurochrysis_carterae.AAC.1